mgnify:CR=1 FL=1
MGLSSGELVRYDRQLKIIGEDGQLKLKSSTALIVGLGGLGSVASLFLAAVGVGRMLLVDRDFVELSNLNRQILYNTKDIGRAKADVAKEKLSILNPNIDIESYRLRVEDEGFKELIKEADIVLDCLDNWRSRFVLNKLCVEHRKPLIHAGVREFYGQLLTIIPGETPCLNCLLPKQPPEERVLVIGVTPGILGTLQATEAIKFITGKGELLRNILLLIDLSTMEFRKLKIQRNPTCPTCGAIKK